MSGFLNALEGNGFGVGFGLGFGLLDSLAADLTSHPLDAYGLDDRGRTEPLATPASSFFSADLSALLESDGGITSLKSEGKPSISQALAPTPTSPISISPVGDRLLGTINKTVDESIESIAFERTNISSTESHNSIPHLAETTKEIIPAPEGQQAGSFSQNPVMALETRQRIQGEHYDIFYARSRNRRKKNKGSGFNVEKTADGKHLVMSKGQQAIYKIHPTKGSYYLRMRTSSEKGARLTVSIGSKKYRLWAPKTRGENTFKLKSFNDKRFSLSGKPRNLKVVVNSGVVDVDYIDLMPKTRVKNKSGTGKQPTRTKNNPFSQISGHGLVNAAEAIGLAAGTPVRSANYEGGKSNSHIDLINGQAAWAAGYTGKGVVVAVVDTGINLKHSDLSGNIWTNELEIAGDGIDNDRNGYIDDRHGYDFVNERGNPNDDHGHGTFSAGIIAAKNDEFGMTGLAYDAKIMPLKALDKDGQGSIDDLVEAIRYAVDRKVDVLNLSLGLPFESIALKEAIDYANSNGVLVVAAAGNNGDTLTYPGRYADGSGKGLVVGAVDPNTMKVPEWSGKAGSSANYVLASGVGVESTLHHGGYGYKSGTSVSTAYVAALAAVVMSSNPKLNAKQVGEYILKSAKPI